MTDIFHEIEEDLRRERLRGLWDRFGALIIALVVLVVLAAAGWSGYAYWQNQRSEEAGSAFLQASTLMESGKYAEAEAAFTALAAEAPQGYRAIALISAANAAAARDTTAGVSAFDALTRDSRLDSLVRDMAALRAALLLVDTASLTDIRSRVDGLITNASAPVRNSAREVLALAQLRAGEAAEANKTATAITTDADATPGLRSRAELIRRITASAVAAPVVAPATLAPAVAAPVVAPATLAPAAPAPEPASETPSQVAPSEVTPAPAQAPATPSSPEASSPEAAPPAASGDGAAAQ